MRYFIFYFYFQSADKAGHGILPLKQSSMPSQHEVRESAKGIVQRKLDTSSTQVVITGFSELGSEEDYDDFTAQALPQPSAAQSTEPEQPMPEVAATVCVEVFKVQEPGHPYPWRFRIRFRGNLHNFAGIPNQCETLHEAWARAQERVDWLINDQWSEKYRPMATSQGAGSARDT